MLQPSPFLSPWPTSPPSHPRQPSLLHYPASPSTPLANHLRSAQPTRPAQPPTHCLSSPKARPCLYSGVLAVPPSCPPRTLCLCRRCHRSVHLPHAPQGYKAANPRLSFASLHRFRALTVTAPDVTARHRPGLLLLHWPPLKHLGLFRPRHRDHLTLLCRLRLSTGAPSQASVHHRPLHVLHLRSHPASPKCLRCVPHRSGEFLTSLTASPCAPSFDFEFGAP